MSEKTPHPDLLWLKSIKPKDAIGVLGERAKRISTIIDNQRGDRLPHTIGLFGTWGSGKTATVAYLADELETRGYQTLYFNAYKYASYMEVVPALIYRLLDELPISSEAKASQRLMALVPTLIGKFAGKVGEAFESRFFVNPVELVKGAAEVVKVINEPDRLRQEQMKEYYTRVDRTQDALEELFKEADLKKPIVVLIDELDRCDPGEAFDAMKQLRILFNMRQLQVVFVLVANPHPIGLAIRHQFGLDSSHDEYEAGRILEKFVDTYIDLIEPESLGDYVNCIWEKLVPGRLPAASFIIGLDQRTTRAKGHQLNDSTLANGTALERMSTSNVLYSNLRTLEKTLALCANQRSYESSLWTIWHIAILKQSDPALRQEVQRVAHHLKAFTTTATLELVKVLIAQNQIEADGRLKASISLDAHSVHSPCAVFYNNFWEAMNKTIRALYNTVGREEAETLARLKSNIARMNFIITACMPCLGDLNKIRFNRNNAESLEEALSGHDPSAMDNFGWILSEY